MKCAECEAEGQGHRAFWSPTLCQGFNSLPGDGNEQRVCNNEDCGALFCVRPHRPQRFCSNECARKGPSWNNKGGFCFHRGRWTVKCRDGSNVPYTRVLVEAYTGREPLDDEVVHHLNEDTSDDRLENLMVVTRAEHMKIHRSVLGPKPQATCSHGHSFTPDNTRVRLDGARVCRACARRLSRESYARKKAKA